MSDHLTKPGGFVLTDIEFDALAKVEKFMPEQAAILKRAFETISVYHQARAEEVTIPTRTEESA